MKTFRRSTVVTLGLARCPGPLHPAFAGDPKGDRLDAPSAAGEPPLAALDLTLWYRRPAVQWVEALPIGSGRLGRWSSAASSASGSSSTNPPLGRRAVRAEQPRGPGLLGEARRLIFAGKYREANELVGTRMMARPIRQMPYQTLGDLLLSLPAAGEVENYRRELDLVTATTRTSYTLDGVRFTREAFASPVDQVIAVRLSADKPGRISFTAGMQTPQKAAVETEDADTLVMRGVNGAAQGVAGP